MIKNLKTVGQAVGRAGRILFIQASEAAAYPPIINAATLMAERGWEVNVLTVPVADLPLSFPEHRRIQVVRQPTRPSHVMSKSAYIEYCLRATRLARKLRPDVVYASDPLGAAPGLLASKASGASLIYHEHDSPPLRQKSYSSALIRRFRSAVFRAARLVIFPNAERARYASLELGFSEAKLRIIWNMPRLIEAPNIPARDPHTLKLYYHGSITKDRLPFSIINALLPFNGRINLMAVGYEVESSKGYIAEITRHANANASAGTEILTYAGIKDRAMLHGLAAAADVGLALMPTETDDPNMKNMVGASCKSFDYMSAGLALIVSPTPTWHETFVRPGYARSCDTRDQSGITNLFSELLEFRTTVESMGRLNRSKFQADWNYDHAFGPVAREMEVWVEGKSDYRF